MILPQNIQQTLKEYRFNREHPQKKSILNVAKLNNFMISRMKNFIRIDQASNDFILNRKFQSESIMKVKKRRQLYQNTRNQRRKKSIDSSAFEISSFNYKKYDSVTLDPREPIHSRKSTRNEQSFQIQRRFINSQAIHNKPFQQLLNITHAIQQHMHNKNNIHHEFLVRKHRTQRKSRQIDIPKPHSKQNFSGKKLEQYRPWSRDKNNNQQDIQPVSLKNFE